MRTNAPNFTRFDTTFIQHGSSESLKVLDENKWYLVKEEREGAQILNSVILGSYNTLSEANSARIALK